MSPISSRLFWFIVLTLIIGGSVWSGSTPVAASPDAAISLGTAYAQNFNTLASSGAATAWTDDSTLLGWYSNRTAYTPNNGASATGALYSYGSTGSGERALGSVGSGATGTIYYGIRFINDTSNTVTSLTVTYTGEQWRNGGNATAQKLDFQYLVNATDISSGTWIDVDDLDFTGPIATATAATLNPPATASLSHTYTVTVNPNQEIWIRWSDINDTGNDHGLGVDDLSVSATFSTINTPTVTSSPTPGNSPTPTNTPTATNTPTPTATPTTAPSCGSPATLIHDIQGSGTASPLDGSVVTIEGVVTARFVGLSGFYVQEETEDGNPATSEGIFVFDSDAPVLNPGTVVRLSGTVDEFSNIGGGGSGSYRDLTEITSVNTAGIAICGTAPIPTPVPIVLPEATDRSFEQYESMLVTITDSGGGPLTVDQNFFQGRYGQVTISSGGRMYNPTNGNGLGDTQAYNARRWIILDDGISAQNPNPIPFIDRSGTPPQDYTLRAGDTLPSVTGIIDQGRINSGNADAPDDYRIHPTQPVVMTRGNNRTTAPDSVGGSVRVASFNVLNYFNGNGIGGGFPTSRGANTLAEFNRQRTKIIAALTGLNADVVGLLEIEKDGNGNESAIQDLVNGLNAATAPGTYAFVSEPAPGDDEIKVAMIYKNGVVAPLGNALNYQTTLAPYGDLFDRPPLAQLYRHEVTGEQFVVVVNHFKSKGSCPTVGATDATAGDFDSGDGQGCWNAKRVAQANALAAWINNTLIPTYDADVVVLGDLNAYGIEDPINALTSGGLVNQVAAFVPAPLRYSYVFDGFAGYLDHALSSLSVNDQITGVTVWHINADEPSVIDYNTENKPEDLYSPTPYRSSDHDPVLLGLSLRAADYSDSPMSYGLAWHTAPRVLHLGAGVTNDHPAGNNDDNPTDDGVSVLVNRVLVEVTGPGGGQGWLTGWADLNNDGLFASPAERIVNQLVTVGPNTIPLASDLPTTSLRFRFRLYESSSEPFAPDAATPTGGATGGEVEDFTTTPLAAELSLFEANAGTDGVQVRWETASEAETLGFNLWRGTSAGAPTEQLNGELIPAQAPGGGGAFYEWLDANVASGTTYYYWLEIVDRMGNVQRHGPVSATMLPPTAVTVSTFNATPSVLPMVALMGGFLLIGAMVLLRHKRLD